MGFTSGLQEDLLQFVQYRASLHGSSAGFENLCFCCCLPLLPQLVFSILATWERPYSEALYSSRVVFIFTKQRTLCTHSVQFIRRANPPDIISKILSSSADSKEIAIAGYSPITAFWFVQASANSRALVTDRRGGGSREGVAFSAWFIAIQLRTG